MATPICETILYKGPITACEFYSDDLLLIGYGPYLSLVDANTFNHFRTILALKYRVIHKILFKKAIDLSSGGTESEEKLICIFGQKAINLLRLVKKQEDTFDFESLLTQYIEMDDLIFDIYWLSIRRGTIYVKENLFIVCAHNQFVEYDLEKSAIERLTFCAQRCML